MPPSDTETDDLREDPLPGRRLASYEVLTRVARGGMGVVYRARHVYIGKIVALKVLDPELSARPDLIERFRTEAQSLARVEHENVVKVNDILEDQGLHFIVMDFAEGVNLRRHVKQHGPMPADELLSVARQTAEALYAAHREGILHRDIKPENLIMNSRGRCKLVDFGLAGDLRLITRGHDAPGGFATPAYSPSEVLKRAQPDNRSDIFSYGATLYFLATGEPPFGQTGATQILLRQHEGAAPLQDRRPDLPLKLARVITDCLAIKPQDRPESFREILDRLPRRAFARAAADGTGPTGLVTAEIPADDLPAPLSRWWGAAAVLIAGAAVVTVGLAWWLSRQTPQLPPVEPVFDAPAMRPAEAPPAAATQLEPLEPARPPAAKPEDEAFNEAELTSRTALSRAEYGKAREVWLGFAAGYPGSELADEAMRRAGAVSALVKELRESEYRRVKQAADQALALKRTEQALAEYGQFPAELLVPFGADDELEVAELIATQRDLVLAAEATDRARVLQQADELRREWTQIMERPQWSEAQRMHVAGNLLRERELLEDFLYGRLHETRTRIEKRLTGLRKLIENVRTQAQAPVSEWREFNDQTLGEWAAWARAELRACEPLLAKRDLAAALAHARNVARQLAKKPDDMKPADPRVDQLIHESTLLARLLQLYVDDIRLAESAHALVETELRSLRNSGAVRDFAAHAEIDADGERSPRLVRYSGRIVTVGNGEFSLDAEAGRVTLRVSMLSVATVRRLLAALDRPAQRLALVAWLALQGRGDDAQSEAARLDSARSPGPALAARTLAAALRPAPAALRTLDYLQAKAGLRPDAEYVAAHGVDHDEGALLTAQRGILAGDPASAAAYLEVVRRLADMELVHRQSYARALELSEPAEVDLRIRTLLEPHSPDALTALAARIAQTDRNAARAHAGRALLLDAGYESAWELFRPQARAAGRHD